MKIAIAFYGQPRYVKNKHILDSYKKYFLDKYDCDVFGHMWWGDPSKYDTSSWNNCVGEMISPDSLDFFSKNYNPIVIKTEEPREFEFDDHIAKFIDEKFTGKRYCPKNGQIWCQRNYSNLMSHLHSMQESSRIVSEYADNTNIKYDFIVLARYDTILFDIPNLYECDKGKLHLPCHHGRFPDVVMFCPHKHLTWSGNLFDDISNVYDKVDTPDPVRWKYESFISRFPLSDIQPARMDGWCCRSIDDNENIARCFEHRNQEVWERSKGYYK